MNQQVSISFLSVYDQETTTQSAMVMARFFCVEKKPPSDQENYSIKVDFIGETTTSLNIYEEETWNVSHLIMFPYLKTKNKLLLRVSDAEL